MNTLNQISRYLAKSSKKYISFGGKSKFNFIKYLDFDKIGNHFPKKSTLKFVFALHERFINYNFKKQLVIILLLTKAEYVILSSVKLKAVLF